VTQLVGYEVSTTQVTNHLRKWKVKYQRIEKLRMLSGALWDDDRKEIVLEEQHYLGHTQVCTCSSLLKCVVVVLKYVILLLKCVVVVLESCHIIAKICCCAGIILFVAEFCSYHCCNHLISC
jgi:hypothetical protein